MSKDTSKAKFDISFVKFLLFFYNMTLLVGLPETDQFTPVDIIPPWFSILI
jgi:hypothetical protein